MANKMDDALLLVRAELFSATSKFGPFASSYEGIAVIREEYLELEAEVFHGDPDRATSEAVQLAAMATRFLVDISMRGEEASWLETAKRLRKA